MKLWLLQPVDMTSPPWYRKYDVALGFVVRAESERDARSLVRKPFGVGDEGDDVWASSNITTCTELKAEGPAKIIISAFHAG